MTPEISLINLTPSHFNDVIELGNEVHGDGYLFLDTLMAIYKKGLKDNLNASYVLYEQNKLIGFRLSYAPHQWSFDQWCSPELWPVAPNNVAYFKCNTIHPSHQGKGYGGILLAKSIETLKEMGAKAGLSHIWMQSPGNASFKYFTKAGGTLIKTHPRRWHDDPNIPDYVCILCGHDCFCDASEMLLEFK